jgi:SIR2-like domain
MDTKPSIIFLFGAGDSLPAGLPDIRKMTDEFFEMAQNDPELSKGESTISKKIQILKTVTNSQFSDRQDLESFMTLISRLGDNNENELYRSKYDELKEVTPSDLHTINAYVENFIRSKLENITKQAAEYLYPLQGFLQDHVIEIFTLNYDGIADLFCENCGLEYFDGFSPFWSPKAFDDPKIAVKIYKLHGSLYWFKTKHGKSIRIPVKDLDVSKIKYISNDDISEMIIYPTLQKEKYSEIYTWLSNRFISSLREATILVIVGYSFRDKDITNNIKQALEENTNLWIAIISPNASALISNIFADQYDLFFTSRIISVDYKFEEILTKGNLYHFIDRLKINIKEEKETLNKQYQTSSWCGEWGHIFGYYSHLHCQNRIIYLRKKLINFFSEAQIDNHIKVDDKSFGRWPE